MSSYSTTVYISDEERDALLKQIRDTNNYVATKKEQIEKIRRETEATKKEIARIREDNEREIQQSINNLIEEHRRNLEALSDITENEIDKQSISITNTISGLRQDARANTLKTTDLNNELSTISQTINATFNQILSREKNAQNRADMLSKELRNMIGEINRLNPAVLKPVEYQRLLSLAKQMNDNILNGDYNAALTVSQNGIVDATQLLTRLTILNDQYNEKIAIVGNKINDLNQRIRYLDSESGGQILLNTGSNPIEYNYDISSLSDGLFDSIKERTDYLTSFFNQNQKRVAIDQLDAISNEIDELSNALEECDKYAREQIISTDSVFRTAEAINGHLCNMGWKLQKSGFKDNNDKKPYTMTYVNGNGSKLAAVISSSGNSEKPSFIVEVLDDNKIEADIVKKGVMSGLQSMGATITAPVIGHDCGGSKTAEEFITKAVDQNEALRQSRVPKLVKMNQ